MGRVKRMTYKYVFKVGNRIKHVGITSDLSRRGKELTTERSTGHIKQVGRRTTRDAARKWAQENR